MESRKPLCDRPHLDLEFIRFRKNFVDLPHYCTCNFTDAFPEKLEEESFEKWRERCRDKEKNFVLNAGKILRDPNHKVLSISRLVFLC